MNEPNGENKDSGDETVAGSVGSTVKEKSIWKLVSLYIGGAILVVMLFLVLVGTYYEDIVLFLREKRAEKFLEGMAREEEMAVQAMKEDTFGGKTPEETLDMLILALEAGDIELASRYYLPWEQSDKLKNYQMRASGDRGLEPLISYFSGLKEKGEKECVDNHDGESCVIKYEYVTTEEVTYDVEGRNEKIIVPKGVKDEDLINFSLNQHTNVWKISR